MNDTIANIAPNDLDLLFQGKQFETLETVRPSATCETTLSTWRSSNILFVYSANEH